MADDPRVVDPLRRLRTRVAARYPTQAILVILVCGFESAHFVTMYTPPVLIEGRAQLGVYVAVHATKVLMVLLALLVPRWTARWFLVLTCFYALSMWPLEWANNHFENQEFWFSIINGVTLVAAVFAGRRGFAGQLVCSLTATLLILDWVPQDGELVVVQLGTALLVLLAPPALLFRFKEQRHLAQRRAEDLARRDPLTGLLNRRALEQAVDGLLAASRTAGTSVGVLVCDLDRFKMINDVFGHQAGDEVLVRTAEAIGRCIRGQDLAARTGGEEFVVVLAATDHDSLHAVAERIRVTVAAGPGPAVTVSIGAVRTAPPPPGTLPRDWLEQAMRDADVALYTAKRAGRDRVSLATPRPRVPTTS